MTAAWTGLGGRGISQARAATPTAPAGPVWDPRAGSAPRRGTWEVGRDALRPQLLLQVRVDFGDVLDRNPVFGDIPPDAAGLG